MLQAGPLHGVLLERFPELDRLPQRFLVVGGAVRDLLLGANPVDVDLAGEGAEAEARGFASRTRGRALELGRDPLRVWRVFTGGRIYDFAEIQGGSIEADLARRDFTIDALAYRMDTQQLIDLFGGVSDLDQGVIRMISEQNLLDDPLRMLKAVRMAARFGFAIEPETAEAIRRHAAKIDRTAPERVTYEIDGILSSGRAVSGFEMLSSLGFDLFEGPVAGAGASEDPEVTLALLLRDRSAEDVERLGRRWRWSTQRIQTVAALLRAPSDSKRIEVAIFDAGPELAAKIAEFLRQSGHARAERFAEVLGGEGERIFGMRPLLRGEEIAAVAKVDQGPALGAIIRRLLEAQLLGEISSREEALQFVTRAGETMNDDR